MREVLSHLRSHTAEVAQVKLAVTDACGTLATLRGRSLSYIMLGMDLYVVELEPEVRAWPISLSDEHYGRVMARAELLAAEAETLGEPYSRHLGGKVRELRLRLDGRQVRLTYWLAPGRRVVLLTVFHKTRSREAAEVRRAVLAQRTCESEHGHATEVFDREV